MKQKFVPVVSRAGWPDALRRDASDRARRLAQGALILAALAALTRLAAEASVLPGNHSAFDVGGMMDVASGTG